MYVLLKDCLTVPPSYILAARDLSLYVSLFLGQEVLLISDRENKDAYWKWLGNYGARDFIKEIVNYGEVNGLYIDNQVYMKPTIRTDKIVAENLWQIINQIKGKI